MELGVPYQSGAILHHLTFEFWRKRLEYNDFFFCYQFPNDFIEM